MKKKRPKFAERLPPLDRIQRELMVAILMRCSDAFVAVEHFLDPSLFGPEDRGLALVTRVLAEHWKQFQKLPSRESMLADLQLLVAEDINPLSPESLVDLDSFVMDAYAKEQSDLSSEYGISLVKRFLKERTAARAAATLDASQGVTADLTEVLNSLLTTSTAIESMQAAASDEPFPDGVVPESVISKPSGISFLDRYFGSDSATVHGPGLGEVNGILGPFGSCKTLLMTMLVCEGAFQSWRTWVRNGKEGERILNYLFAYEAPQAELRTRAMSYAARIDLGTLGGHEGTGHWDLDSFSRAESLKPYEKLLFMHNLRAGEKVLGEFGRYQRNRTVLNHGARLMDMTGTDPRYPNRGRGGIKEIAGIIQNDLRTIPNSKVGVVCIDYASLVAKRQILHSDGRLSRNEDMRLVVNDMPLECRDLIAIPFRTSVWISQQLDTRANAAAPGATLKTSQAKDAKDWDEHLAFSFVVGKPNQDNRFVLCCDKRRRAPPRPPSVVRIDGALSRALDESSTYTMDSLSKKIVSLHDLNRIADTNGNGHGRHKSQFTSRDALLE